MVKYEMNYKILYFRLMENRCYYQTIEGLILEPQTHLAHPVATFINETHFVLNEPFIYHWRIEASNADRHNQRYPIDSWIIVKAGFRWDGASVPKLFRGLGFATDGKHRAAALIHDFIYVNKGKLPAGSMYSTYDGFKDQIQYGTFSRFDADRLFFRMMGQAGVNKTRKKLMWFAVSKFGWIYWQDGPDLFKALLFRFFGFLMMLAILLAVILT